MNKDCRFNHKPYPFHIRSNKIHRSIMKKNRILLILIALTSASAFAALYLTQADKAEYSSYIPPHDSAFKITFEYPSNWNWKEYDMLWEGYGLIHTHNPDVLLKSSGSRDNIDPDLYQGWIGIFVSTYESPEETRSAMNEAITTFLKAKEINRAEVLSDKIIEIDGLFARQITVRTGPALILGQYEPQITERIYFLTGNSYYCLSIDINESMRDSEFSQGFDHMLATLRFIH